MFKDSEVHFIPLRIYEIGKVILRIGYAKTF
jgi:hypothetical protein